MGNFIPLPGWNSHTNSSMPLKSYTAHYLIFHFLFAYTITPSRAWKMYHKIDHQVSPRGDLAKYGPIAVQRGKITQAQLDQMIRVEACHANSMEHFPVFVGAMVLAEVAGVGRDTINMAGGAYTLARLAYALSYVYIKNEKVAVLRGIFWWASNSETREMVVLGLSADSSAVVCLRLLWKTGVAMNEGRQ